MSNNFKYQRGSEWRKWDLHVHTPASYARNLGSWVRFTKQLIPAVKKHEIHTIALADYFTIAGYKEILEYYNKENTTLSIDNDSVDLFIIPGIELRLNIFNSEDEALNIHILFDPQTCSPDFIENNFLEKLKISYRGMSLDLKERNLIAVGKSIIDDEDIASLLTQDFTTLSDSQRKNYIKRALTVITLSKNDLVEALREIDDVFKGMKLPTKCYLIGIVGKGHGNLRSLKWFEQAKSFSRAGLIREDVTCLCDFIFSDDSDDRNFYLGKIESTPETEVKVRFGCMKPCVWGSDSQQLDTLLHPSNGQTLNYTWIKANPTFEGLKQIIYEPDDRVRIQENNPETFKIANSYDSIKISNSKINAELEIKEIELPLNRDLITIIGGKGAGKTALLDLIANCYVDRVNSDDKNSFARRIAPDGQTLKIELKFLDNSEFNKTLMERKFISSAEIEYIPQGQIESLITKHKDFHYFLQKLIFESSKIKDSVLLFEYEKILQSIDRCKSEIIKVNREIYDIEVATKKELFEKVQKDIELKTTEKNNLAVEIEIFKKQLTDVGAKEAKKVQQELSLQQIRRNQLLNLEHLINEVFMKFEVIKSINDSLTKINTLLMNLDMSVSKTKFLVYRDIESELGNIKKTIQPKLSQVNKVIEETRSKIAQLDSSIKKHSELLKRHDDAKLEIVRLKEKLADLNKMKELLMEKRQMRLDLFKQLLKDKLQIRVKYKHIINAFSVEAKGIMSGLEFDSSFIFDVNAFEMEGEDIVDLRNLKTSKEGKISVTQSVILEKLTVLINRFANFKDQNENEEKNLVNDFVNELSNVLQYLIEIRKSIRTNLHLYEWLFADYFVLNTVVYFNKIPLDKLSLGQKCTVLLKVYLAQGKNPILIDQPDDNLDNKFIMDELVTVLRQAKKNRQVIIVSNNANIVVNSDAEQLIVAEFDKGIISYIAGSIENPQIKEKAIQILEGGPKAFENREKKYGLKH